MTAADRPSVTDDARAVIDRLLGIRGHETFAYGQGSYDGDACRVCQWQGPPQSGKGHTQDTHREAFTAAFMGWAAGRAETTTTTTEDAAQALARAWAATAPTKTGGFDAMSPHRQELLLARSRNALEASGLLATARTRPTREAEADPARALDEMRFDLGRWLDEATTQECADALTSVMEVLVERAARLRGGDDQ